jgi:hypothetical protein
VNLATRALSLLPVSEDGRAKIAAVHQAILRCPQVELATEHLLHGGMYVRTIRLPPGTKMVGSYIKVPTVLIVRGSTAVFTGDGVVELEGYNVLHGCAGRQQVFVTRSDVEMTMIFPTSAKTVAEAEDEVFGDAEQLMSRADGRRDTVLITGE